MSLFHGYPRVSSTRSIQEEYEREHDAAELALAAKGIHFAVAPRRTLITPLGRTLLAGDEVTVDDFAGHDLPPFEALKVAVFEGEVVMARSLGFEDPKVKRVPTVTVSNAKVIADPDPEQGWQPHHCTLRGVSEHMRDTWRRLVEETRTQARHRYVVAPMMTLKLRDGTQLKAGDEVKLEHFRCSSQRGSQFSQLQRLLDLSLVLETFHTQRGASDDGPQAA